MRRVLLALSLSFASVAVRAEPALLWEVTAVEAQSSGFYLALHGARASLQEARAESTLLESSDGREWKKIPLAPGSEGESIRSLLATDDVSLYLLTQRLSGDAEEAVLRRYRRDTRTWDEPHTIPQCQAPQSWKIRGTRLQVQCLRGKGLQTTLTQKSTARTRKTQQLQVTRRDITLRYDEIANELSLRAKRGKKEVLPSPAELAKIAPR